MKTDAQNDLINIKISGWTEKTGEVLFTQATQLARKGMYIQAERALTLLLKYTQPSSKIYLLLGKIYAQQRRYNDAITKWETVLTLEPNNNEATKAIVRAKKESQRAKSV
jgi:Flp pilus assembly protein TadD